MKRRSLTALLIPLSVAGMAQQQPANRPTVVAGIPVNYQEDSVGSYVLPDLLTCADGQPVTTAKIGTQKRRPELVKLVEETQFGKMPPRPEAMRFRVVDSGTPAFQGKAIRKQVTVYFTKDTTDHRMSLLMYLPTAVKQPVPLLLSISFAAPNQIVDDPGIRVDSVWTREGKKVKADKPTPFGKMNVNQFLDAGLGFATVYYGDIEPDFKAGINYGIRKTHLKPGQTQPATNEWGAISAWVWGLSRALDYFETDKQIDAKRIMPVYHFGIKGPETTVVPAAGDTSLLLKPLGYFMHEGRHGVLPTDWAHMITYLKNTFSNEGKGIFTGVI